MTLSIRERFLTAEDPKTPLLVAMVVLLLLALVLPPFQISLVAETLAFAIWATAFNLLYGYTGLLSFGHAMFVATAGYAVAKTFGPLSTLLGFGNIFGGAEPLATFVLALVLGVTVATIFAIGIGYLAVQLEEIYFAMITLSFSMAIYAMGNQDIPGQMLQAIGIGDGVFTNGSDGLTIVPGEANLFGFEFQLVNLVNPVVFYVITVFVFVAAIYALYRIVQSPFGMTCRAIRENPQRARALGIDVTYHSWMTFIISGAFSGLAGVLLVTRGGAVDPQAHAFWTASAAPVIMTVIGGPLSFIGPIIGAVTFEYLRWIISQFPLLEEFWEFSFGLLILVVVLFFENGVAGGVNVVRERLLGGEPDATTEPDPEVEPDVDADADSDVETMD